MIRTSKNRTQLRLERLENRTVPSILDIGANINISQLAGNQSNASVAVNPSNPNQLFAISDSGSGNFAAYSTDGGTTWTQSFQVQGTSARAVFDDFGNLFVASDVASTPRIFVSVNGGQTFATKLATDVPDREAFGSVFVVHLEACK
jgi:hypothetical protein